MLIACSIDAGLRASPPRMRPSLPPCTPRPAARRGCTPAGTRTCTTRSGRCLFSMGWLSKSRSSGQIRGSGTGSCIGWDNDPRYVEIALLSKLRTARCAGHGPHVTACPSSSASLPCLGTFGAPGMQTQAACRARPSSVPFLAACSLDFFKSPVQKMVPCGNLFEVRWSHVGSASIRGWGSAAGCCVLRDKLLMAPQPCPCNVLWLSCRLWPRRCTWRCPPTARWAQMARPARRPRPASLAAQVGRRQMWCGDVLWLVAGPLAMLQRSSTDAELDQLFVNADTPQIVLVHAPKLRQVAMQHATHTTLVVLLHLCCCSDHVRV